MDIKEFLKERAKNGWDLNDVLFQICSITETEGTALLVKSDVIVYRCVSAFLVDNKNDSRCIKYIEKDFRLKFNPLSIEKIPKENIGNYIETKHKIGPSIIVPIFESEVNIIGYILLWSDFHINKDTETEPIDKIIDKIICYISILQLICQRQKLQFDFENLNNDNVSGMMKTLFLANVTHELRSPMQGIVGYSQFLTKTQLDITQQGYVNGLTKCSTHLMQIMNDILDFSKLSSGKMIKNDDIFQIKEIVSFIKDAMNIQFYEKKQIFKVITEYEVPDWIIADKGKIIQILMNILSNANKFTKIGGIIQVNISRYHDTKLEFSITDNGSGISDIDQCKLFNCFTQLDNAKYTTGTGLGLYIAKKLCDLLEGEIYVKSSLGKGSTFVFRIPFKEYVSLKLKNEIVDDLSLFKNKHVLIVDDNNDNRVLLSQYISDIGMIPVACSSALEASKVMFTNRYSFSLGLIDVHLGSSTGDELAKMIREEYPFFRMIALSSYDTLLNSSLFEYKLEKPVNKNHLYNLIYIILKDENEKYNGYTNITGPNKAHNKDYKFIIVDDNSYNANIFVNMLNNISYTNTAVFTNGREFLDFIEECNPLDFENFILILDLLMPIMNGIEVLQYLRDKNIKIPVIVITASVMEEYKIKCEDLNVKYFMNKPITSADLRKALTIVLK